MAKELGRKNNFSHGTSFSSGVALLIPKQLTLYFEIKDIITDQYGRLILVECVIHNNPVILISVYFPTKDKPREQTEFLDYVKQLLYNYNGQNIIIGGDFNICLNLEMDKHGGSTERESTYVKNLKALMQETNLINIWRVRNPQIRRYSRREMSKKGLVQSRIDFWLVSVALEYQIKSTSIKPGNSSDHSIIKLGIELLETQKRGKGYWKFNNSLLRDQNYVNTIRKIMQSIKSEVTMENKNQLWDFVKCRIRSETIDYSIKKARENKKREKELTELLITLENALINNENKLEEYVVVKKEWEKFQTEKLNGSIIRSKAFWAEDGEKNTKYFLNLEKRNYNIRHIKKLICEGNTEITDPNAILQKQKDYYENLYKSKYIKSDNLSKIEHSFLNNTNIPKLCELDKAICENPLEKKDYTAAIKKLANDKSPGSDGLT